MNWLLGFRSLLIRHLGSIDLEQVTEALGRLDSIERFVAAVREIEASAS